jgi:transcriptional regulator with XRE-family HTH domain
MGDEGMRLREVRKSRGLTQQGLADQSGIDREKIAKIETGGRRMSATDAAYLSQALGVRMDDLVGRPRSGARFRLSDPTKESQAQAVADWFEDYVRDVFFLERSAKRNGLA